MATSPKEQFAYMITQNKGAALEKIIEQILMSEVYTTSEFLSSPNIKSLGETNKHYYTLKLFSNGTFSDYQKEKAKCIALNEKMLFNLKLISLIELAKSHKLLSYSTLKENFDLKDNFSLEEILFSAISRGLIVGKVDMQKETLSVVSVKPRHNLNDMTKAENQIDKFIANIDQATKYIDGQIENLNKENTKSQNLINNLA